MYRCVFPYETIDGEFLPDMYMETYEESIKFVKIEREPCVLYSPKGEIVGIFIKDRILTVH